MQRDNANTAGGFYGSLNFGSRPVLLVVDFQRGFTEPGLTPLASNCDQPIASLNTLIRAFRGKGPIIHTVVAYRNVRVEAGPFLVKCASLATLEDGSAACEIDPRIDFDESNDLIIKKTQASAFHGTSLASLLSAYQCDSLIVTGCTTSGCVRASVVDALQNGFSPFVPADCVADRSQAQHDSNLVDMASKYAQVCSVTDLIDYLGQ
ncbi:isochorismatase family protein [Pollutimonas harenae]|uniref:Isochorismatase family protein n=1 Tax=Pollutimonas harenae TaxID=657015 RepID=A0A853H1J0_9BURK|nr:isochorismatase family protein [Pollutimonas harenae]NYT84024.1 isochorismatase family protein [Pollutimonas harenae]TEA73550.1 isochorismatase family protein [Pollutimonas harenae]